MQSSLQRKQADAAFGHVFETSTISRSATIFSDLVSYTATHDISFR